MKFRFVAPALTIITLFALPAGAQQSSSEASEVWRAVERRWKAWEKGDLQKMLQSYHPSFHAWNRVTGHLDDNSALMGRWNALLEVERVDSVKLEPVKVVFSGGLAAAYYVSREKVARITRDSTGKKSFDPPIVISSLSTEYLAKWNGQWMTVGTSSVQCTESEPEGSACRKK